MSQHRFVTTYQGRPVELLMGWDRPLRGFFMVVSRLDSMEGEDEIVYSNLDDSALARCGGLSAVMDHFLMKLANLAIDAPQAMLAEVERDSWNNVGNRHVTYDAEGRKASES